ncbi:MAG: hypothetical protein N3D11_05080 [Candidatus Sumerlaeia bacterium]|nr:hypothetical protein [Candidatus Sumerlaeia bacterium]
MKKDPAAAYKKAYLERGIKDKDSRVIVKKGEPLDVQNTTCPLAGATVVAGQFAVFNSYKVGFCCPSCEKTFFQSPEKFLSQLGARPTAIPEKLAGSDRSTKQSAPPHQITEAQNVPKPFLFHTSLRTGKVR